jgi:hypothetical protein
MGMEHLAFHNELVADLPADHQQHNLRTFDIIQHAEVADPEFELRQRMGPQALDGAGRGRRLVREAEKHRRLKDPLIANRKRAHWDSASEVIAIVNAIDPCGRRSG